MFYSAAFDSATQSDSCGRDTPGPVCCRRIPLTPRPGGRGHLRSPRSGLWQKCRLCPLGARTRLRERSGRREAHVQQGAVIPSQMGVEGGVAVPQSLKHPAPSSRSQNIPFPCFPRGSEASLFKNVPVRFIWFVSSPLAGEGVLAPYCSPPHGDSADFL